MNVGDLLISKESVEKTDPLLIILDIEKARKNSDKDLIKLQWLPRNGGYSTQGVFPRHMVEAKFKVL